LKKGSLSVSLAGSPLSIMKSDTIQALETLLSGLAAIPRLEERISALEEQVATLKQRARSRPKWLTLAETAQVLRCSQKSVTRMIAAGKLRKDLES
jgi:hypothetical protein